MVQTQVNSTLAKGITGEYADDSPHREQGYILNANTIEGAAASGSLAFGANPADNDTVTIGAVVYRFKNTLEQANDIKIGTAATNTVTSLEAAVNGDGTAGTDYFEGTSPVNGVTASASGTTLTLTADENGAQGNSIALSSSDENVTPTAFSGGVNDTVYLPTIAHAFTHTDENGVAQVGGTGVFAGVLVNPKMFANYLNLNPTLTLPSGIQGGLCTFGHIYIQPDTAFAIGNVAAFDKLTGKINAYVNAEAVPSGSTLIPNAKFIKYSGAAGDVATLELNN